jgi:hypothetical protein
VSTVTLTSCDGDVTRAIHTHDAPRMNAV